MTDKYIKEAAKLLLAANAWPRCGKGWPCGDLEQEAANLLVGRNELGRTPEEEAVVEAYYVAQEAERRAQDLREQAALADRLKAAILESGGDIIRFLGIFGPASLAQVMAATGLTERQIACKKMNNLIKTNRKGSYLL